MFVFFPSDNTKKQMILCKGLLLMGLSTFLQKLMYCHDCIFDVNRLLQCKAATQNAEQGRQLIRHKGLQFWCSLILLKYIIICFPILMQCLPLFNWNGFCSALLQNKAASDFQIKCPEIQKMWNHIWQWKNQAAEPPSFTISLPYSIQPFIQPYSSFFQCSSECRHWKTPCGYGFFC